MQPFDFTTQMAVCGELRRDQLPARLETVYQLDRHTLSLGLRTFQGRSWLTVSWHPQAARLHLGEAPPRSPDTFTFSQQLQHQLKGLALSEIEPASPWERVLDLQFAQRPGEPAQWHLYVEIMGKHSNVILVNREGQIVTAAHQVSTQQSRVRPIQTGQPYTLPPGLQEAIPSLNESQERWQERVDLIPGPIAQNLLKTYRGLSSSLTKSMAIAANLAPETPSDQLSDRDWTTLFERWQQWLVALEIGPSKPAYTPTGYTVMGWDFTEPVDSVQTLVRQYYGDRLNQQNFSQYRHQLSQKLSTHLGKLGHKAQGFRDRLGQSDQADQYRAQADLLMAYLHQWQPGLQQIQLPDFETNQPVTIPLNPERNASQNAQALYKQHQKLKRARAAVEPLLAAVETELYYLEQVESSLTQLDRYTHPADLIALTEIREELIQQGYLSDPDARNRKPATDSQAEFHTYTSPNGFPILVGRNNRQNDQLTFRVAKDYDLWLHAQEISGSHVLLRLEPGAIALDPDLQYAADLAAFHSRARQSDQVPVIYTEPQHVYKPKGAKPGMVVYKRERVLWGQPQRIK